MSLRLPLPSTCAALLCIKIVICNSDAIGQIAPIMVCSRTGIGAVTLTADAPVTVISVTTGIAGAGTASVPYCLVKVRVPQAINLWIGLPMDGRWNGRLQSEGGGGYDGVVGVPVHSILRGYVGIQSDGGHTYREGKSGQAGGAFGLLKPGVANTALQKDFAYRSEHLMAVLGKELAAAFYGHAPTYAYWNGCSEGGREGLRMAQDFPNDYEGIVAGAPAIAWDRAAAYEMWPQVVMKDVAKELIPPGKLTLATAAAVKACDAIDAVTDGIITDPRRCTYSAAADTKLTRATCDSSDSSCLTPAEAVAVDLIWRGPVSASGETLWPGVERGAPLDWLAGAKPSGFALDQARYWVYLDPTWDWRTLTLGDYQEFFDRSVRVVHPVLASDRVDLSAFRAHGGKLIVWHGFSDPLIMPRGSIHYYERVAALQPHGDVRRFFRLFLAPGVGHCGGGDAPQPGRSIGAGWSLFAAQDQVFEALVAWVERGRAPDRIPASQRLANGAIRTRPLCAYPAFAKYSGRGSTDDEANFVCAEEHSAERRVH